MIEVFKYLCQFNIDIDSNTITYFINTFQPKVIKSKIYYPKSVWLDKKSPELMALIKFSGMTQSGEPITTLLNTAH